MKNMKSSSKTVWKCKRLMRLLVCVLACVIPFEANGQTLDISELGLKPNTKENAVPFFKKAIELCKKEKYKKLYIPTGRYDFYPFEQQKEQLYISAHDHRDSRYTAMSVRDVHDFTIEGNGSSFVFHDYMLPISLIDCDHITLQNFSIDFETPYYSQALIKQVTQEYADIEFSPEIQHSVMDNKLYLDTEVGKMEMLCFMVFDKNGKYVVPNTGDLSRYSSAEQLNSKTVRLYGMSKHLQAGNILFMRNAFRPNPGIFSWRCKDLLFEDIDIYWAQGMGTLSQRCENITMNRVNVKIKPGSNRYFTTVDALHFTACKGLVSVNDGLYENMQDDAINVHGDYLQIQDIDFKKKKMVVSYKHFQSFGYEAVLGGETIQFISRKTMLPVSKAVVLKATRLDDYMTEITFAKAIPHELCAGDCIENIDWVPEVSYRNNVIRNNRARGALFSTPLKTVVANNLFENCSGSAILLSSDCNSWFLSGACRNVRIENNRFYNCMTSYYQYCEGIISIYPEMPIIANTCYHANIRISKNHFVVDPGTLFLYAKSVDGLSFTDNKIEYRDSKKIGQISSNSFYNVFHCNHLKISGNFISPSLK